MCFGSVCKFERKKNVGRKDKIENLVIDILYKLILFLWRLLVELFDLILFVNLWEIDMVLNIYVCFI